jgi:hypothetical protein
MYSHILTFRDRMSLVFGRPWNGKVAQKPELDVCFVSIIIISIETLWDALISNHVMNLRWFLMKNQIYTIQEFLTYDIWFSWIIEKNLSFQVLNSRLCNSVLQFLSEECDCMSDGIFQLNLYVNNKYSYSTWYALSFL